MAVLPPTEQIDLRQERGRHLDIIEAAADHGRRKAGEVADDAAAERDHQIAALDARLDQRLADMLEDAEALRALAGRDGHHRGADSGERKRALGGREMMPGDVGIGHDRRLGARPQRRHALAERGKRGAADHDVVAARTKRDFHHDRFGHPQRHGHGAQVPSVTAATSGVRAAASAPTISSTIFSCGTSRDWIVMSACA